MEERQGRLYSEFSDASRVMRDMMAEFDSLRRRESNPPVRNEEDSSVNQVAAPHQQVGVKP